MNFKKFSTKGRSPYSSNKTRVRKSYYTFSREYPAGNIPLERMNHYTIRSKKTKKSLSVLLVLLLLGAAFFAVRLPLDIAYKDAPQLTPGNIEASQDTAAETSVLYEGGFRALYMPYDKLSDTSYIRSFIKKIRRYDCNGVVIDFKPESGKLAYSSLNSYAINGKCAIFDNNTVRQALNLFRKENITVAARIFCFLDNTVPVTSPELAVKYMDTDVNWVDSTEENGDKTWLNPCSTETLGYILDIVKELRSFNIKGFILEKCHFPDSGNTAGATFPGDKNFKDKNAVLKLYIKSIKELLEKDNFLIITQTSNDSLNGNKKIYYGSINSGAFDAVASYTNKRPDDCYPDKKTGFSSMLRLFSDSAANFPDRIFMPVIDYSEYTGKYMRTIRKNNYTSYIIFDEAGEY
ncbi:MAG: hypothetical protein IJN68_04940 [Clostridia bacterium]|nr:hypothetical protein [Clostridia bacterium]